MARAAEMSTMTAGISPALAGTCCAGSSAPVTLRAAARMSLTGTDSPAPRISGPVAPACQERLQELTDFGNAIHEILTDSN